MKNKKLLISVIITAFIVGLWFGFNLGKGQPFYSNPFAAESKKLLQSGGAALERSGQALEKSGQDIKETFRE
ncbi:MAG: hypothetical protein HY940_08040 [Gammaproteobacteria bacterium]|nr:hypothetical protein [Gammaproteobacteria bacterium]